MTMLLTSRWAGAAQLEAARTRVSEIDIDHLYLGLLAVGGQAARILGRHGVSLSTARRRVRESLTSDLDALGLAAAESVLPPPRAARDIDIADWRATDRAHELVNHAPLRDGTAAALGALIEEPSGVVRRLLAADGVDPDELRTELATSAPETAAVERSTPTPPCCRRRRVQTEFGTTCRPRRGWSRMRSPIRRCSRSGPMTRTDPR